MKNSDRNHSYTLIIISLKWNNFFIKHNTSNIFRSKAYINDLFTYIYLHFTKKTIILLVKHKISNIFESFYICVFIKTNHNGEQTLHFSSYARI